MRPTGGPRLVTRGARGVAAALVLLGAVGSSTLATAGTASASGSVSPVLECVWHVTSTQWLALWGYSNTTGATQNISVGANNAFSPGAPNQGQPTSFQPGTVNNLFTVPGTASEKVTWTIDGASVAASASDKKCSQDPVPIAAGTSGWSWELPLVFVALGILVVGLGSWRVAPQLLGLRRPSRR